MIILGNNSAYAPDLFAPSLPPLPALGDRIDNKATVVGILQDHEGNNYILAVVDAAYRSGSAMTWSSKMTDTVLNNNSSESSAKADHHTGKYSTDLILNTYTATDYPAFNFARNACTVTFNGTTYYSVLPSVNELQLLNNNKDVLDQYDPTVSEYSSRSMSTFKFGGQYGCWATNEREYEESWFCFSNGGFESTDKTENRCGVCPVICIPLS